MAELTDKRLFLLDMDGTLYLDDDLFPGTVPFLRRIWEKGGRYLFLTNNSSRGADSYVEKLRRLGIESVPEDFLTSVDALILFLRKGDYQGKPLYVAGTESFRRQLRSAGFSVTSDREEAEVLICGFDTRRPRVIGKPQPEMALLAMESTGFAPEETVLVGDRLYTDIACAVNAGIDSVLVLSGESTEADLKTSETKPRWVLRDVAELTERMG